MPIYKIDGKRDGKQKYRVRINYQDSYGTYKQSERIAYGFEEAKALEIKLGKDIKETPASRRMTVLDLFNDYKAAMKTEVRESTLDKNCSTLEYHILPTLGGARIDKLTIPILQGWKASLAKKDLSLRTKRNIYNVFNALLNYAVRMQYITNNLLSRVGIFKDTENIPKKMQYYNSEEFKLFRSALLQYSEKSSGVYEWNYYVFFMTAFYMGMRKGEIHAMRWSDIEGNFLSIKHSITQKLEGDDRETGTKNKSSIRTIQIPTPLMTAFTEHKNRCERIEGFDDSWFICGGLRPLRDTTIQNRNKQYADKAGIKSIRIHDFRHSHASLLANEGINIQEIARRLGHSKVEITWNTYSHLYPREEERATAVLDMV